MGYCPVKSLVMPEIGCDPQLGGLSTLKIGVALATNAATISSVAAKIAIGPVASGTVYRVYASNGLIYYHDGEVLAENDVIYGDIAKTINAGTVGAALSNLDPKDENNWVYDVLDVLPESSNYNIEYSYDKATGLGIFTSTITAVVGSYSPEVKALMDALHYKLGRPIKAYDYEETSEVIFPKSIWTAATAASGTAATDANQVTLTFETRSRQAPEINNI